MKFLNNVSIGRRLLIIVCLSILFFISFSAYAIFGITRINQLIDRLIEHPLVVSNAALEAQLSARELRDLLQDSVLHFEDTNIQLLVANFNEKEKELDSYIETIEKNILDEDGKQLANKTKLMVDEWKEVQHKTLQLILNNDFESANAHFNQIESEYSQKVLNQIHDVNIYATAKGDKYKEEADQYQSYMTKMLTICMVILSIIIILLSFFTNRSVSLSLNKLKKAMSESAATNQFVSVHLEGKSEIVEMSKDYNKLIHMLKDQFLLMDGQTRLNSVLSGENTVNQVAERTISFLAEYINAGHGVFYIYNPEQEELQLISSYAYTERDHLGNTFKLGQGIIGQTALEQKPILLKNIKKSDLVISTGTSSEAPFNTFTFPLLFENQLYGVIELSSFEPIDQNLQQFLIAAGKIIAISLFTTSQNERIKVLLNESQLSNSKLEDLLESTQKQAKELQIQQEELRQANEELEQQTEMMRLSEEKLKGQQEELKVTNEELEERTKALEQQKNSIVEKNEQLLHAQTEIEEKARQLEVTSKYKSEFLANMSHELRTPLNSILVLSQMLAEKKENNPMNDKQLQYAKTILDAGQDLIKLINDILDISKVEAGRVNIVIENTKLENIVTSIQGQFKEVASQKGLRFTVEIEKDLPTSIKTDRQRLEQILKNLISNAIKFTEEGEVTVTIGRPTSENLGNFDTDRNSFIRFDVSDSGIGIPKDKQHIVFEAFQQVDGTISRKYGGTGLGLSISRELTKLLNGKLLMKSTEGMGSTFTLLIPESIELNRPEEKAEILLPSIQTEQQEQEETVYDKSLLIIDDDPNFIRILTELADEKKFHYYVAMDGETGLKLAKEKIPTAIILDIKLPDMNGWDLYRALQGEERTRHIPVHVISGTEKSFAPTAEAGNVTFLQKPVRLEQLNTTFNRLEALLGSCKNILVVDDDKEMANKLASYLADQGIQITIAETVKEALEIIKNSKIDGMIFEFELDDKSDFSLLGKLHEDHDLPHFPIIIHTRKEITPSDEENLKRFSNSIILKGTKSLERLQAEATLFLHEINTHLPPSNVTQVMVEESLSGKKILLVDDDMRNIFALSSMLEDKGMTVFAAKNGKEGIEKLINNPDIDIILMDIMMPEMDGYTAMKEVRTLDQFNKIPIIAVTAKAMKEDRSKCIEAGANDYLTKPIDNMKLLSLLRVWLYQ